MLVLRQGGADREERKRTMFLDEDAPRKKRVLEIGCDLSALSIEELRDYLAALEAEAVRVKALIEAKQSSRNAADQFFKC